MAAKKKVAKDVKPALGLDKVDGHLWGIADAILEHAGNVASYGQGTLKQEGEDLKLLAQELKEFLDKSHAQRRKIVADDLRHYNRYVGSKKK